MNVTRTPSHWKFSSDCGLYRTRCFTDSGVIGTKAFVLHCSQLSEGHFSSRHAKRPRPIAGLPGKYALKRLSELRSSA